MNTYYTVFGIYCDNMQRHADQLLAKDPTEAERKYRAKMKRKGEDMMVAAVVAGKVNAVDAFCNSLAMDNFV